jgi:hypothetical protein
MPKKEGMKRKVITDIVQNLLSAFIPLGLLQLVILPSVSKSIGGDKYGLVLTLVALLNTVPASFGNALNNIRLLKDDEYRQKNLSGDFNYLVLTSTVVSILIILVMTLWYYMERPAHTSVVSYVVTSRLLYRRISYPFKLSECTKR